MPPHDRTIFQIIQISKMKIIALIGKDKCGKTETLTTVYLKILDNKGDSTCRKTEGNPIFKDFSDIVKYKGLKVAFFTMGDYSTKTIEAIKIYKALNIDVLVIACNIKFVKPIKLIKEYNHHFEEKTFIKSNTRTDHQTANNSDACKIYRLIRQ